MFSLLWGLWEYFTSKAEFQVLILGIDHAGKTTLLEKMKGIFADIEGLAPDKIAPTVGLNIGRFEVGNVKLIFWDLGGQIGLRGIWDKYFAETQALIYVVDSANTNRFDESRSALDELLADPKLDGVPLLFLANKQDLPTARPAQDTASMFDLGRVKGRGCRVQPVSAISGRGIREGITWLVDVLKSSARRKEKR
eukprot:tig00000852_g5021.t1